MLASRAAISEALAVVTPCEPRPEPMKPFFLPLRKYDLSLNGSHLSLSIGELGSKVVGSLGLRFFLRGVLMRGALLLLLVSLTTARLECLKLGMCSRLSTSTGVVMVEGPRDALKSSASLGLYRE